MEGKNISRDYRKDKSHSRTQRDIDDLRNQRVDNVKTRNEYFVRQQGCEYKIRL